MTKEHFPEYPNLSELLERDLSAYEFFQTLPAQMERDLRRYHGELGALEQLHIRAACMEEEGGLLR